MSATIQRSGLRLSASTSTVARVPSRALAETIRDEGDDVSVPPREDVIVPLGEHAPVERIGRRRPRVRADRYSDQLRLLGETYREIRSAPLTEIRSSLTAMKQRQALYVGSGGAFAVAQLAADIHEAQTRMLARAGTPLDIIGAAPLFDVAVMLFTASARHPDAAATVEAARRSNARPISIVTHRTRQELPPPLAAGDIDVVTLPSVVEKEGFLATNSVLAMATALVAASGFKTPALLPHLRGNGTKPLRENTLILGGPGLGSVATDLETRLSETGLSGAQVTDYRNFAHGRHTGLARRLETTTIVALITPEVAELAEATLSVLPADADVLRLESRLKWPVGVLDLLVASMKVVAATADESDLEPSRPSVPAFGRRLYHLSSRPYLQPPANPVERKVMAARTQATPRVRRVYEHAMEEWLEGLRAARLGGLVLDYDGTVCTTDGRFELPDESVRAALLDVLRGGTVLGFASGRGGSLHRDLRHWVPKRHWDQIEIGLYNGGLALLLADDLAASDQRSPALREVARRLRSMPIAGFLRIEEREHQLGIEAVKDSGLSTDMVVGSVLEVLAWPPAIEVKVVASAHSVDVVPAESAKTATLNRVRARTDGAILAIGDQGQVGGNDFELLASTTLSLSVDRVSSDPTRCWNLDQRGESGPELLVRYLTSLRSLRGGLGFRWRG